MNNFAVINRMDGTKEIALFVTAGKQFLNYFLQLQVQNNQQQQQKI